jgi:hypothetical protein
MSEWISVKDGLPEDGQSVLVTKRHSYPEIVVFDEVYNCWDDSEGDDYYRALDYFTHWMPLPENPEFE